MPVVKGGVWTNIEDEILKASVSKYGLNQWARVSSLLARKTPKQCKARWAEWLDPSIRKVEWSKEEDEKLLHLAKLMPTQWRTLAPLVGRTANQCLERYQKLLDEAEARESGELGLTGVDGAAAPSADDVRKLRPGEVDPDPESKPARPDTIDLDEDEKEMLSEARARLANTQGKKAKRKARERQLEESRRLAVLQKRRELKNAGINIKITNKKTGQMDYNADIPFEKRAAAGFYDTTEEIQQNQKDRDAFDPRKQQLANKRKGDGEDDGERKKRKNEKDAPSASYQAALKAGAMQKMREAEQSQKRRALVLPTPQVGEQELEEIVKMGLAGERANATARASDNDATRGLVGTYNTVNTGAPIRTPRAPPQEDHIANEIKNIRALTETQSSLLGGDNTPLYEGAGSTGFDGVAPRRHVNATPNPMATPFRGGPGGALPMRTPGGVGATPARDAFALNQNNELDLIGGTPRDVKLREMSIKHSLAQGLASLPKPKEVEWELELPEEQQEPSLLPQLSEEDAELRDRQEREAREARERLEKARRTQVMQKGLPRPKVVDVDALLKEADAEEDEIRTLIAREAANLLANDAIKYPLPGLRVKGKSQPRVDKFEDAAIAQARKTVALEVKTNEAVVSNEFFENAWRSLHKSDLVPGLVDYEDDDDEEAKEQQEKNELLKTFDVSPPVPTPKHPTNATQSITTHLLPLAEKSNKLEKKLGLHLGGYAARARTLRAKTAEAHTALKTAQNSLTAFEHLRIGEEAAIGERLERLREEVAFVARRGREAQEAWRGAREEVEGLGGKV
jgi:pre-mRNA-splicing factor CDC5/CEF1